MIDHDVAWAASRSGISYKAEKFARAAKINTNPTGVNKAIWFKNSPFCKICKKQTGESIPQTQAHILGSCAISRGLESEHPRNTVTWRHNEILKVLTNALSKELNDDFKILVDLPGHKLDYGGSFPTQWLSSNSELKPDLIILPPKNAPIIIGELTSPCLQTMKEWNVKKENKYKNNLVPKMNRPASVRAFEVGHLGETNESLNIFLTSLGLKKFCKDLKTKLSVIAVECSNRIFQNRDNAHWTPGFAAKH